MDALASARLAIGSAFLVAAAASDLRTRRVPDPLWVALGTIGLFILLLEVLFATAGLERLGLLAGTAILFYAIFFGEPLLGEHGLRPKPARIAILGAAALLVGGSAVAASGKGGEDARLYLETLTMPVMVLAYQGFYLVGLLHGGADAKGMTAITLLVPTYPNAAPFPLLAFDPRIEGAMHLLFPFSLVVFVNAAILYLALPIAFLGYNAAHGDIRLPQALFGYRIRGDRLPKNTWLMERIDEGGEHALVLFPRRGRDQQVEMERLRAAGIARPWVQPKIPLMVPLGIGYVMSFVLGNVLLVLIAR